MTLYRSEFPINFIPDPDPDDPDPPKQNTTYQSICRSINWPNISTRPDATTALYLLASYQGATNHGQYEAALYALIELVVTSSFGPSYHSDAPTFTKYFFTYPFTTTWRPMQNPPLLNLTNTTSLPRNMTHAGEVK